MSYVGLVSEAQASPATKQLYQQIREKMGFLPNYFQALGRLPGVIAGQLALADGLDQTQALPRVVKERVGMVVSGINASSYCVAIHMELLRQMGVEKALSRKLATNYAAAPVGEEEQALYRFADKLTRHPDDMNQADVEALRQAGWSDQAVAEAVVTVAYFNLITRVSTGLGLVADF
jgi:uncharacterized peroxidase-related enzyme